MSPSCTMPSSIIFAVLFGAVCLAQGPQAVTLGTQPTSVPEANDTDTDDDFWPSSDAAHVVRYIILAAIILAVVLWLTIGIWHANVRLRKGLQPLWYHRWLVPSYARYSHRQRQHQAWPNQGPQYYRPQPEAHGNTASNTEQSYAMHTWSAPENAEHAPPPIYSNDSPPTYVPPPGPPPGHKSKSSDIVTSTTSTPLEQTGDNSDRVLSQPNSAVTVRDTNAGH